MSSRARRTAEVRREEILTATAELLERVGLRDIRVADVAAEMGVSTSLVFYHFDSKDALVLEAFGHAFASDLDDLDAALQGADSTTRLRNVARLFDGPDAPLGWRLWIDACAVSHREPEIHAAMRRIDRRCADAMRRVLEDGVADGTFVCPDPAASVERILALNDGLSTAVTVLGSVTREQLQQWMANHIAIETGTDPARLLDQVPSPVHAGQPTD